MRCINLIVVCLFSFLLFCIECTDARAQTSFATRTVRFIDSATGFSIRPEVLFSRADGFSKSMTFDRGGWVDVDLEAGNYSITVTASNYHPFSASVTFGSENAPLRFTLDPITRPEEIQAENVRLLQRPDATVFVGYISGSDTGDALADVQVVAEPSGVQAMSDRRGFFQITVPLQTDAQWLASPARLVFFKEGYKVQERLNLELAPFGDFTLRVEMKPGQGNEVLNEQGRRIDPGPNAYSSAPARSAPAGLVAMSLISPTNATVRLPTNIRVELSNGTIDYVSMETYVQRSLNDEWIASWGSLASGAGINSLKAGAVAVRSYAAWHVNNPRGANYDICATTSCQVYDTDTSSNADTAASQTAGYVVIGSNGLISRSEYSAENNSIGPTVAGVPCGDGYTEPSTTGPVCLFDPACSGEVRFGHGRGMCQWGTARWATGFKMSNRSSGDTSPNGFPQKDWMWIVNHYYPALTLVLAKPLVVGDDIEIIGSTTRTNHMCAGGGIGSGADCPVVFTKPAGSTGVIIAGPQRVTSDGRGFTWWKVTWSDNSTGWIQENYIERALPVPGAPSGLSASAMSGTQINLSWNDTNNYEAGFQIDRSPVSGQPWQRIAKVGVNTTTFSDTNVTAGNTYYYRVRAFNVTGNSSFSGTANAVTPGVAPTLAVIGNRTVAEGVTLTFTNTATAADRVQRLANFENFDMETTSGSILFRSPRFSGSTSGFLAPVPDYSSVTELFPSGSGLGKRALLATCYFTNATTSWLRLSTASASTMPNPVVDFRGKFQFRIHASHAIDVGLGLRESTSAAGLPIGADGGNQGAIEWAGVTNVNSGAPMPSRTVPAGTWTTLTFDLPNEPVRSFVNGNNVLSTASGLGVLEHIAIVPRAGTNIYRVFLDNLSVLQPKRLTYSLGAGAPAGASVNADTGVFTWTPSESQGPTTNTIQIVVSDDGTPVLKTTNSFTVVVTESNAAPLLAPIASRAMHVGSTLVFTNTATDTDIPAQTLSYALGAGAPAGASIISGTGVFSWSPGDAFSNTTNSMSIIVSDNGSPVKSDSRSFTVVVFPAPALQSASVNSGNATFTWSAIPGKTYRIQYKNNLSDIGWIDLADIQALGNTISRTEPVQGQRYYRVMVLE